MRRLLLAATPPIDVIQYGCSAHILNLLAEDIQIRGLKEHIIKVIKYFRNKHLPSAWYKGAQGKMLVIPQEVRWNTVTGTLKSYLENRGILVQVCQDHKDAIDHDIFRVVNDINITVNAKEFLNRMEPVAIALDRTIAVSVEIWKKLEEDLQEQPRNVLQHFRTRKEMALTPSHYLANLCDHRFRGSNLNNEEKHLAFQHLDTINPNFIQIVMALNSGSKPFPQFMLGPVFQSTSPMIWWKALTLDLDNKRFFFDCTNLKHTFLEMCSKLLTAVASSAGLARIFSTFGLVQSKLRNRLGTDTAAKLTFIFKFVNQDCSKKATNLDWLCKQQQQDLEEPVASSSSNSQPEDPNSESD